MAWEQLLALDTDPGDESLACPECGTPLGTGPRGERYCPFDGWRR